jgi:aminoglycoside phosphotransferase (APT) family kinase protein
MNPEALERWLETAIRGWTSVRVDSIVEVPGGWESDVYDLRVGQGVDPDTTVERLALRRYPGDGAVASREFTGMHHLHAVHYPVPEVLGVEPSPDVLGRPFMVMRWADGEARSWDAADLEALAGLMADLHRLDWRPLLTGAPAELPGAMELVSGWRGLLESFPMSWFAECLDWASGPASQIDTQPAIVHLDFHTGNVLIGPNGTATVIDWTQVGVGDRRMDVAWTELLISMALDRDAAARYRAGYEQVAGSLEHMEWFEVIMAAKRLFSVVVSVRAGSEALGMRPEARERMIADIHTLSVPWQRVKEITAIDVVEARQLFEE